MADMVAAREFAQQQVTQAQALIDQIQGKMQKVVTEFSHGDISREQFEKIYEHYQAQIVMAAQMAADADTLSMGNLTSGETVAIRSKLIGKAKAMTVYYHDTGLLLETIGDFDVSVAKIAPTLNNIGAQASHGVNVPVHTEKIANEWLLYVPGRYSTAVMLFSNEPAGRQISIIENMHHDFEAANETALKSGQADGTTLIYPFQSFVRRTVKK
jgi:hypothetical protein